MAFELPKLNYAFNALEPHIDAKTMEIHHGKHHQAYVTNLNNAIAGTDTEKLSIEEICKNISKYPAAVRNNGGGSDRNASPLLKYIYTKPLEEDNVDLYVTKDNIKIIRIRVIKNIE